MGGVRALDVALPVGMFEWAEGDECWPCLPE